MRAFTSVCFLSTNKTRALVSVVAGRRGSGLALAPSRAATALGLGPRRPRASAALLPTRSEDPASSATAHWRPHSAPSSTAPSARTDRSTQYARTRRRAAGGRPQYSSPSPSRDPGHARRRPGGRGPAATMLQSHAVHTTKFMCTLLLPSKSIHSSARPPTRYALARPSPSHTNCFATAANSSLKSSDQRESGARRKMTSSAAHCIRPSSIARVVSPSWQMM